MNSKLYGYQPQSLLPEVWNRRRIQSYEDHEAEIERKKQNKIQRKKQEEIDRKNDELVKDMKRRKKDGEANYVPPRPSVTTPEPVREEL